jgi:hypothetical protein
MRGRTHRLTAMARRIEGRQALFKSEMDISQGRNQDLITVNRNPNPLINAQMRRTSNRRRQANTQVITPLLDIENCFCHGDLPEMFILEFKQKIRQRQSNRESPLSD